jgi:hypothetical protein
MTTPAKTTDANPVTPSSTSSTTAVKAAPAKAAVKATAKRAAPVRKAATGVAKAAPTKAVAKPAAKVASKPVAKPVKSAKPSKPVATPITTKPVPNKVAKVKKPKMVRDSFTIPKPEYDVLNVLKLRAVKLGSPAKKTELVRAGIKLLATLSDAAYRQALSAVPSLKTGRPAKAKKA